MDSRVEKMTEEAYRNIPQIFPRQDSLISQIEDLIRFAKRLGMHDAAEYLESINSTIKFNRDFKG